MLYVYDKDILDNLRFVYNDEDNSVKLMDTAGLDSYYWIKNEFIISGSSDWYKLKLLGFVYKNLVLSKKLFTYDVDDDVFEFKLCVHWQHGAYILINRIVVGSYPCYFHRRSGISDDFWVGNSSVMFCIPSKMLWYVLDLYSRHDFYGIMKAFNDLFGVDLYKITTLDVFEVSVKEWL